MTRPRAAALLSEVSARSIASSARIYLDSTPRLRKRRKMTLPIRRIRESLEKSGVARIGAAAVRHVNAGRATVLHVDKVKPLLTDGCEQSATAKTSVCLNCRRFFSTAISARRSNSGSRLCRFTVKFLHESTKPT